MTRITCLFPMADIKPQQMADLLWYCFNQCYVKATFEVHKTGYMRFTTTRRITTVQFELVRKFPELYKIPGGKMKDGIKIPGILIGRDYTQAALEGEINAYIIGLNRNS